MDDLYDPAEVYGDEDDSVNNRRRNGDCSDVDDNQSESKNSDMKGEESDFYCEERFLRTEGCETKRSALQRLSPSLDALKNDDSSSESHVHKGCIFRLVIFNIPLCVTDVSKVQQAVQSVLEDDGVVEFVDGVYMRSAVVCIKPVSAVEKAAQKLTTIDDLPVIARKMTSKDYNIFCKKKEKSKSKGKLNTNLGEAEKEVILVEDDDDKSSPMRVTISNVSHKISAKNLADTLRSKVGGIIDVVLHSPPPPNRLNRQHSGKGYVSFHSKTDAVKFFPFHRMRVAGRDLIIHRSSMPSKKESFPARGRVLPASARREYRLKISNLSVEVSSQELQEIFAGEVNGRVRVSLGRSEEAPHSGSGVLVFETAQLAKMAHELMDGCDLGGSKIVLQMDFDENETHEDCKTDSNDRVEDKVTSGLPTSDFKTDNSEKRQRDREQKQRDRDRREDREKDGQRSRKSPHRSLASSEGQLPDSRGRSRNRSRDRSHDRSRDRSRDRSCDRSRDRNREKSRESAHDRSRHGSADRNQARDRSRDRTRHRSRERSRDRTRDRSRDRTRDRSRGRSKGEERSRGQSMDTSRDRSRSVHAADVDYRRYRGIHIYADRDLFVRRSCGPHSQLQFSNIAYNLPEEKLIDFVVNKCSGLMMVHYGRNKLGAFQGVALLEFKSRSDAVSALKLRNTLLEGRKVVIKIDVDGENPYSETRSPMKTESRPLGPPRNIHGLPGAEPMNQGFPLMGGMPRGGLEHPGPIMGRPEPHGPIMGRPETHAGPIMGRPETYGGPIMGGSLVQPNDPQMRVPMMGDPGLQEPLLGDGPSVMEGPRLGGGALLATPTNRGSFGGPVVTREEMRGAQLGGAFPTAGRHVGDVVARGAAPQQSRAAVGETISRNPGLSGHHSDPLMMRGRVLQQSNANQVPQHAQQMTPDRGDPSAETYGLSTAFLESLGITLPLVKEVLVMNVDAAATEDDLKELFSIAGTVAKVQYNQQHGQAIVEMAHPVEAVQSISMLHQQEYFDRIITVRLLRANDPENLVARALVAAKPRGLKTIGRGLGIGGMPVSALPPAPANSQPSNSGLMGKMTGSGIPEHSQSNVHMNANTSVNKKSSRVSRWGGKDENQRDIGQTASRFAGQNHPDVLLNFPSQPNRGAGADFRGQQMSRDNAGEGNLHDKQFRDRRGVLPTPQTPPLFSGEQNRNFHSRGSTSQSMGQGNRSSDSTKFSGSSNSGWSANRDRNDKSSSRGMNIGHSNLNSRRDSSSSRGRGLLNTNRGRGFGSPKPQRSNSNLNVYNNAQESASSGKIVILSNLPLRAHQSAINDICSPFGLVKDIELNSNRRSCRVTFDSYQQASMAADILNNQDFIGSTISATMA